MAAGFEFSATTTTDEAPSPWRVCAPASVMAAPYVQLPRPRVDLPLAQEPGDDGQLLRLRGGATKGHDPYQGHAKELQQPSFINAARTLMPLRGWFLLWPHERGRWFRPVAERYGQVGRQCARCGTPIRREHFMNRSSFFCPRCQPAPRSRA